MTDSIKTFVAGEKLKASDTNSNNQYIISLIDSVGTDLQTYLEQQIAILSGNFLQPGFILAIPFSTVPTGYLECDGSSLLREDYDELFDAIGTTYGAADDYHFNLPDYQGVFLRGVGGNAATLGTKQLSGAPNITGRFGAINTKGGYIIEGAFSDEGRYGDCDWDNVGGRLVGLDASRSSSVYQDELTEIRPDNMSVKWVIKY